jgi:hypothetical protein
MDRLIENKVKGCGKKIQSLFLAVGDGVSFVTLGLPLIIP